MRKRKPDPVQWRLSTRWDTGECTYDSRPLLIAAGTRRSPGRAGRSLFLAQVKARLGPPKVLSSGVVSCLVIGQSWPYKWILGVPERHVHCCAYTLGDGDSIAKILESRAGMKDEAGFAFEAIWKREPEVGPAKGHQKRSADHPAAGTEYRAWLSATNSLTDSGILWIVDTNVTPYVLCLVWDCELSFEMLPSLSWLYQCLSPWSGIVRSPKIVSGTGVGDSLREMEGTGRVTALPLHTVHQGWSSSGVTRCHSTMSTKTQCRYAG